MVVTWCFPRACRSSCAGLHHAVPVSVHQPHHIRHYEQAISPGIQDSSSVAAAEVAVPHTGRQQLCRSVFKP